MEVRVTRLPAVELHGDEGRGERNLTGMLPMKRVCVVLVATALLGFGTASQAAAEDVAVIVNNSNPVANVRR